MKEQFSQEEQTQALAMLTIMGDYVRGALEYIETEASARSKSVKEKTDLRDSLKGALVEARKEKKYNIDTLNYTEINDIVFGQKTIAPKQTEHNQTNNPVMTTIAGISQDLLFNPLLNFTLGETLQLSPEIISSDYGKLTEEARAKVTELQNNPIAVEIAAAARLLIGNLIINKSAWLTTGFEVLPDPKWLKCTETYKYSCSVSDTINQYTPEFIQKFKEYFEAYNKIYSKQAKNLAALATATLSKEPLIPIALAAIAIGGASITTYSNNEKSKAIADEKAYLERYIDAKSKTNSILQQNPILRKIPNLITNEVDSISVIDKTNKELEELCTKHPILKKIFDLEQQKFTGTKEKIMFVQALKELVEQNNKLTGKDKIWNDGDTKISKGRVVLAQHYFVKAFKNQVIKYKDVGIELYDEIASSSSALKLLADPKLFKITQNFFKAISLGDKKAAEQAMLLLYTIYTKNNIQSLADAKEQKVLREISALRMEVPSYNITRTEDGKEKLGNYKHDLANMAFEKQAQAMALEAIAKKDLTSSKEQISTLYAQELEKAKDELKKDPLFSEHNLAPTMATHAYNVTSGILNAINPWGTKISLSEKAVKPQNSSIPKAASSPTQQLMKEVKEFKQEKLKKRTDSFDSILSEEDLRHIRKSCAITPPGSPTMIATNFDQTNSALDKRSNLEIPQAIRR